MSATGAERESFGKDEATFSCTDDDGLSEFCKEGSRTPETESALLEINLQNFRGCGELKGRRLDVVMTGRGSIESYAVECHRWASLFSYRWYFKMSYLILVRFGVKL